MLHLNTVEPETMKLLHQLMNVPELADFLLVDGTNLSLRFGHRVSVDLDLFTNQPLKLKAMATRGVKKDFWDIAELLNHVNLPQMLLYLQQRYSNNDPGHILLAMTYFVDADVEKADPISLTGITWEEVKNKLRHTVNEYVKSRLSSR